MFLINTVLISYFTDAVTTKHTNTNISSIIYLIGFSIACINYKKNQARLSTKLYREGTTHKKKLQVCLSSLFPVDIHLIPLWNQVFFFLNCINFVA